jgi:hypothetical protein
MIVAFCTVRAGFDFLRPKGGFINVILRRNRAFYQNKRDKRVSAPLLYRVIRSFQAGNPMSPKRLTSP